jgi:hypothetical protein
MALVIDEAHEVFGFFRRSGVDVTQESIQREGICTDRIRRIMDGLRRHTVHFDTILALIADPGG